MNETRLSSAKSAVHISAFGLNLEARKWIADIELSGILCYALVGARAMRNQQAMTPTNYARAPADKTAAVVPHDE